MRLIAPSALPSQLLPATHAAAIDRCGLVRMDEIRDNRLKFQKDSQFEERPMKNINKVGVTEGREMELRELMRKLKQSGQVGTTGMMSDMDEGGALQGARGSTVAQPPSRPAAPPPVAEPPPSPPPLEPSATGGTTAPEAPSEEARAEDLLEDGKPKSTGSVGGRWVEPAEPVETMKPKVSTWGVFERPADMSKAYGGGKKVGIGGFQESEEERQRKQAEIQAKLKAYRATLGGDYELQEQHKEDIEQARAESRQLMRYGDVRGALNKLLAVEPWLCEKTEFGGYALIDLGWAYDASGDRETARKVMARLRRNVSKDVRRMSQQLAFQDEAAGYLGVKVTTHPSTHAPHASPRTTSIPPLPAARAVACLRTPSTPPTARLSSRSYRGCRASGPKAATTYSTAPWAP